MIECHPESDLTYVPILNTATIAECIAILTEQERTAARRVATEVWDKTMETGKLATSAEIMASLLAFMVDAMVLKRPCARADAEHLVYGLMEFIGIRAGTILDRIDTQRRFATVGHG